MPTRQAWLVIVAGIGGLEGRFAAGGEREARDMASLPTLLEGGGDVGEWRRKRS
jgi:hypothetical protein